MAEKTLLTTRELAQFLSINEKMVYTLIAEKGLPATKATGKWLFPRNLVEQWLEAQTINFPNKVRYSFGFSIDLSIESSHGFC